MCHNNSCRYTRIALYFALRGCLVVVYGRHSVILSRPISRAPCTRYPDKIRPQFVRFRCHGYKFNTTCLYCMQSPPRTMVATSRIHPGGERGRERLTVIRAKTPLHPVTRLFSLLVWPRVGFCEMSPLPLPESNRGGSYKTLASLDAANLIFTLRPFRKLPKCYTLAMISSRNPLISFTYLYIYICTR